MRSCCIVCCRYSLALLDVGKLKSSYIRRNSFHDGFNTAIGVFGTDELTVVDNVIHHTVGSAVRVWGRNNKVLRNLAVLSVSPGIACIQKNGDCDLDLCFNYLELFLSHKMFLQN